MSDVEATAALRAGVMSLRGRSTSLGMTECMFAKGEAAPKLDAPDGPTASSCFQLSVIWWRSRIPCARCGKACFIRGRFNFFAIAARVRPAKRVSFHARPRARPLPADESLRGFHLSGLVGGADLSGRSVPPTGSRSWERSRRRWFSLIQTFALLAPDRCSASDPRRPRIRGSSSTPPCR